MMSPNRGYERDFLTLKTHKSCHNLAIALKNMSPCVGSQNRCKQTVTRQASCQELTNNQQSRQHPPITYGMGIYRQGSGQSGVHTSWLPSSQHLTDCRNAGKVSHLGEA